MSPHVEQCLCPCRTSTTCVFLTLPETWSCPHEDQTSLPTRAAHRPRGHGVPDSMHGDGYRPVPHVAKLAPGCLKAVQIRPVLWFTVVHSCGCHRAQEALIVPPLLSTYLSEYLFLMHGCCACVLRTIIMHLWPSWCLIILFWDISQHFPYGSSVTKHAWLHSTTSCPYPVTLDPSGWVDTGVGTLFWQYGKATLSAVAPGRPQNVRFCAFPIPEGERYLTSQFSPNSSQSLKLTVSSSYYPSIVDRPCQTAPPTPIIVLLVPTASSYLQTRLSFATTWTTPIHFPLLLKMRLWLVSNPPVSHLRQIIEKLRQSRSRAGRQ